jgi:hypothetical protein
MFDKPLILQPGKFFLEMEALLAFARDAFLQEGNRPHDQPFMPSAQGTLVSACLGMESA